MNRIRANVMIAGLVAAMIATGCHRNVSAQNQANDLGPDPAAANMAPGDGSDNSGAQQQAPAGQGTNEAITAAQSASPNDQPPADQNVTDQNVDQGYSAVDGDDDVDYDDAEAQADQAPPPLPDYVQPPLPGDGYLWTPGYWAWSPAGYYWVPGAWTMPPYSGALWTPGWWGFHGGRYFFFRGYWGHYIGYYGGINYGFGYGGRGYEGGYWNGGRFQYNRSVNVIRINNVNVYNRAVRDSGPRVSYNGPGGARLRPAPAEIKAMRGPRVAPMSTQIQAQREAQGNRGQFANANKGRPASMVAARPLQADQHTQALPPARIQQRPAGQQGRPGQPGQPNQQQRPGGVQTGQQPGPQRPGFQQGQQGQRPGQPATPQQPNRPQPEQQRPNQPQTRPAPDQQHPQGFNRPAQPAAPQAQRPTPQPAQQQRPQSFARPSQPAQQARPTPQPEQQRPQNFSRPAPAQQAQPQRQSPQAAPRPAPEARPAPAPRPAPQAAPRPAPASRPAPQGGGGHEERPH